MFFTLNSVLRITNHLVHKYIIYLLSLFRKILKNEEHYEKLEVLLN